MAAPVKSKSRPADAAGQRGIFSRFQGALDNKGEAFPRVQIPNAPALSGFRFYAAAITVNLNQLSVISDPIGVTIR